MQVNKKNTITRIMLVSCLAGLVLMINSCKKLITIDQPANTLTTTSLFVSDAQANSALAGIYSLMMSNDGNTLVLSNGGLSLYAGLSADELVSFKGRMNQPVYQFETNTLDVSTNNIPASVFWNPAYHIVYIANATLEGVAASTASQLTANFRKQVNAECEFVRAFNFFYLTNLYGAIPLPLTADFTKTTLLHNTPQADVYKQIIKDLQDAQTILPADYSITGGERIRPNKWAATALLARVYLYQKDWKNAEVQASAVINAPLYGIETNLDSVFNKNGKEAVWQLQPNKTSSGVPTLYDLTNFFPKHLWLEIPPELQEIYLSDPVLYKSLLNTGLYGANYLSPQLSNAFESGDMRKTAWLSALPSPEAAPYNGHINYMLYKYRRLGSSQDPLVQYYMVLRLAEQYLIRAEARAQQGDISGAISDLNVIRQRAGLPNTAAGGQAAILDAIAQERRIELFGEFGHRFFDLKRTGKASAVLGAIATKQPWHDYQLLYPIPTTELKNDPNLKQNPGYGF